MTGAKAVDLLREIASAVRAAWPAGARTILPAGGEITGRYRDAET